MSMSRNYRRLGELLVARSAISSLQLSIALADQRVSNRRLGEVVIDRGYTTEAEVAACLAYQCGYTLVDVNQVTPQPEALARLTAEDALALRALPIEDTPDGLVCAISDPIDVFSNDKLAQLTRCRLQLQVAPETSLLKRIRAVYGLIEQPAPTQSFPEAKFAPDRYTNLVSLRRIGDGLLFEGIDTQLDRTVSLTAYPEEDLGCCDYLTIVQSAAKGHLDGIAGIYECRNHGGFWWTSMQRLSGESLEEILKSRSARSLPQAAAIVSRVAEIVDGLQRNGGVGTWPCPSNILIRASGPLVAPLEIPGASYTPLARNVEDGMPGPAAAFVMGRLLRDCLFGLSGEKERELPGLMQDILTRCALADPQQRYGSAIEVASALRSHDWEALLNPGEFQAKASGSGDDDITDGGAPEEVGSSLWSKIFKGKVA